MRTACAAHAVEYRIQPIIGVIQRPRLPRRGPFETKERTCLLRKMVVCILPACAKSSNTATGSEYFVSVGDAEAELTTGDAGGEASAARKNEHGGVPQAAGPVVNQPYGTAGPAETPLA